MPTTKPRIYSVSVSSVYPLYVTKAERKGRTKQEVDEIILWLTGYTADQLTELLNNGTDFEKFFTKAPLLNPNRTLINGLICGIRVENMEPGVMQEIRYLDKLIDELARGTQMFKILRSPKE